MLRGKEYHPELLRLTDEKTPSKDENNPSKDEKNPSKKGLPRF
jgi:hypothetical protein